MTNYPPGVTGNEFAIAGPDFERELDEDCPSCRVPGYIVEFGYRGERWVACGRCDYEENRTPEWCCDAGPVGHSGKHWRE